MQCFHSFSAGVTPTARTPVAHALLAVVSVSQNWRSPRYSNHVIAFEPQRCAGPIVAVAVDLAFADDQSISRRTLHLIRLLSLNDVVVMLGMRAVARFSVIVSLNAQREKREHGGNQ